MRIKWWILVLILSLTVNGAAFAVVGYNYYCDTFHRPPTSCPVYSTGGHLYQDLGLSPSQLKRMDSLAQAFHARLERLDYKMHGKRELLVDLLRQEPVDSGKIEHLRKDMANTQDEIQRAVITHIQEIKNILDPEQEERFFHLLRISMEKEGSSWPQENRGK